MNKNKRTIILDFDGVISNSQKSICKIYNNKYKNDPNFVFTDYTKNNCWDFEEVCPLEENVTHIFSLKQFFDNLEFMKDAKEIIYKLSKEYNIIICSIGTPENIAYKSIWIKENIPFTKDTIMLTNAQCFMNKSLVNMKNCIFIDDNESNLNSSNADIKICFGKIFNWNKNWKGERIYNWKELYNKIKQLDKQSNLFKINNNMNTYNL